MPEQSKIQARKTTVWFRLGAALWAVALIVAFSAMTMAEGTAGAQGDAPALWPTQSALVVAPGRPTMIMFLHPRCPCSRASLAEFERIAASLEGESNLLLVFVRPEGAPADWLDTGLFRRAGELAGVTRLVDDGGVEAARFGALTSGQTVVYDAQGRLSFHGGITGSRGHEGGNVGEDAAKQCVNGQECDQECSSVYGCPLNGPGSGS